MWAGGVSRLYSFEDEFSTAECGCDGSIEASDESASYWWKRVLHWERVGKYIPIYTSWIQGEVGCLTGKNVHK